MKRLAISPVLSLSIFAADASVLDKRVSGTALVQLDQLTGAPQQLASGFIYGIPDTPNQIPDHFYTDVGFNFGRGGGAQLPAKGWKSSVEGYEGRFNSALSNYRTTREYNASFNLLVHDIWGADGGETQQDPFPGDNGNWDFFDKYLERLATDIKANNMLPGLVLDIWNEPDLTIFWKRSQEQYIEMWSRAHKALQRLLPDVQTSGPSFAFSPSETNTWWTKWLERIASDGTVPSQWSWHMEGSTGDMDTTAAHLNSLLQKYKLPPKQININEYAHFAEQVPAGGAWWIAQLERANATGLRGNWLSSNALHDYMAGLLGKPNAGTPQYNPKAGGHWPAAEYWVYNYYAKNMTGNRIKTSATADKKGDVFATVEKDVIRVLVGSRASTGSFSVGLRALQSVGFPASGDLQVQTRTFRGSTDHFKQFGAPEDLGTKKFTYTNGQLDIPIAQTDTMTAWAIEVRKS